MTDATRMTRRLSLPIGLRQAVRSLRRAPAFAITSIATLGLGIVAVAAMFVLVHGVLLAPLPYRDPERLVAVDLRSPELRRILQPPGVYLAFQRNARLLDDIALYRTGSANITDENGSTDAQRVTATWINASMLPTLGVAPILGRGFTSDEDRPG